MKRNITITNEDRKVDMDLEVDFDFCQEVKERGPSYASGGEPGEPAHVEVNTVRLVSCTTWFGDFGVTGTPEDSEPVKCGDWIATHTIGKERKPVYMEDIENALSRVLADEDDGPDCDDRDD